MRYTVEQASVDLELRAKRGQFKGKLGRVEGTIDVDPIHLERTRARLTADLESLSLEAGGEEDTALLSRAFDWLEIGDLRAGADRARNRYAVLNIRALEQPTRADEVRGQRRTARGIAQGDLTLHHFRVPLTLELDIEFRAVDGRVADALVIRTRRPFVVSLAAHDILPRDARGRLISSPFSALGPEVVRDARVTAELRARATPASATLNP